MILAARPSIPHRRAFRAGTDLWPDITGDWRLVTYASKAIVNILAGFEALDRRVGLLTGKFLRTTLLLLAVQMIGTLLPLVLFPRETFVLFPLAPTLEGQYIIKNLVLISAAAVVGATVRGQGLTAEKSA